MRFGEKVLQYNFKQPVDTVFLDTTYSKPKYVFLPQREAIAMGVGVVTGSLPGLASSGACPTPNWSNKTLFLVGAYNIGKERLLLALGKALGGTKIVVDPKKMAGQISCVFPDENERKAPLWMRTNRTCMCAECHFVEKYGLSFAQISYPCSSTWIVSTHKDHRILNLSVLWESFPRVGLRRAIGIARIVFRRKAAALSC